jgi:hypothetical protein
MVYRLQSATDLAHTECGAVDDQLNKVTVAHKRFRNLWRLSMLSSTIAVTQLFCSIRKETPKDNSGKCHLSIILHLDELVGKK